MRQTWYSMLATHRLCRSATRLNGAFRPQRRRNRYLKLVALHRNVSVDLEALADPLARPSSQEISMWRADRFSPDTLPKNNYHESDGPTQTSRLKSPKFLKLRMNTGDQSLKYTSVRCLYCRAGDWANLALFLFIHSAILQWELSSCVSRCLHHSSVARCAPPENGTSQTLNLTSKWSSTITKELMDLAGGSPWETYKAEREAAGQPIIPGEDLEPKDMPTGNTTLPSLATFLAKHPKPQGKEKKAPIPSSSTGTRPEVLA